VTACEEKSLSLGVLPFSYLSLSRRSRPPTLGGWASIGRRLSWQTPNRHTRRVFEEQTQADTHALWVSHWRWLASKGAGGASASKGNHNRFYRFCRAANSIFGLIWIRRRRRLKRFYLLAAAKIASIKTSREEMEMRLPAFLLTKRKIYIFQHTLSVNGNLHL